MFAFSKSPQKYQHKVFLDYVQHVQSVFLNRSRQAEILSPKNWLILPLKTSVSTVGLWQQLQGKAGYLSGKPLEYLA